MDSLPLTTSKNDSIKGLITLSGTHINTAELQIKLTPHQETAVKATIEETAPYFLEQAQQGRNYIGLATKRVRTMSEPLTKQAAVELLDDLCKLIDRARSSFEYPSEAALFPYKVCHPKYFSPPLKQDLVIEFFIQDVFIVCNVYCLDYNTTRGNKFSSDSPVFVTYKDKNATVVDQAKTKTQSPMLTELKASLQSIRGLCQIYKQMLLQIEV
ncbi:RAVE subunit 2/Rogdi [Phycomyces blakesleeanus]|uniref:RAVE subunit 2/Rogdi n=1 Tax=Phycomyces blakesleeanus TaxID=4837 RepID=A0ABR3B9M9_PHYBL